MASIGDTGGGQRSLNPELNLVPFIDLLSVCICFLLVSAVWLQVGSLQVKQQLGTEAPAASAETFDLTVHFTDALAARGELTRKGSPTVTFEVKGATREEFINSLGKELDQRVPNAKEALASATFVPAKSVPYKSLVMAMDVLRKRDVVNLAVMPKAG